MLIPRGKIADSCADPGQNESCHEHCDGAQGRSGRRSGGDRVTQPHRLLDDLVVRGVVTVSTASQLIGHLGSRCGGRGGGRGCCRSGRGGGCGRRRCRHKRSVQQEVARAVADADATEGNLKLNFTH